MSLVRPLSLISATALLALGALALLVLPVRAQDADVSMQGMAFSPGNVTVGVGDSVTWTNNDGDIPHNVTSTDGGPLDSGNLSDGETFSFTFNEAGTYEYECTIHPGMTGSVTVEAAAATDDDNGMADDNGMPADDDADDATGDATPPATGSGSAGGSGSANTWLVLAAAVLVLALGAGAFGFRTVRNR